MAMDENQYSRQWEQRLAALGSAQSRYLWVLVVAGVFYLSLTTTLFAATPAIPSTVRPPLIGLEVSSTAIWASGPGVLCFLILVILGSTRAVGVARKALDLPNLGPDAEAFDTAPNVIDLAAYSTTGSPKWVRWVLGLSYPAVLTVFLVEAVWILVLLWQIGKFAGWAYGVAIPTTPLTIWAGLGLLPFWKSRLWTG
jgi:hypothetical protein